MAGMGEKTEWQTKAALVFSAVITMNAISAALQTSAAGLPAQKPLEFAQTTVRWVLISIPDRKLALFENGKLIRVYPVAVGKASTPSPAGDYRIVNRLTHPTYYHKGQVIPAGKNNPVGSRWMGLSARSYGIHGTNQPRSIGKAASSGCIRMRQRDLEELFTLVNVGDAVRIRTERDDEIASAFGQSKEDKTIPQDQIAEVAAGGQ